MRECVLTSTCAIQRGSIDSCWFLCARLIRPEQFSFLSEAGFEEVQSINTSPSRNESHIAVIWSRIQGDATNAVTTGNKDVDLWDCVCVSECVVCACVNVCECVCVCVCE